MILQAAKEYDIDLNESYMVGDRETDLEAGKNAGVRSVGISNNIGGFHSTKDVFTNVLELAHSLEC